MHAKKILTIFRRDIRDAVRDARVIAAILMPIGFGLFYNFIFDDAESRPEATVAYVASEATALPETLEEVAGPALDPTFTQASSPEEVRRLVDDDDADVGVLLPAGFDAAVRRGEQPQISVLLQESPGFNARFVVSSLDEALRALAGQQAPATITVEQRAAESGGADSIFDVLSIGQWMVLFALIFLVGMVGVYVVPVILTEESDRRTLDALTIIASQFDVVAAKALVGLAYLVVSIPILMLFTRLVPENIATFATVIALLSDTLIGFGLLLGGICRTMTQLNTWSGVVLLAILFPAVIATLPLPGAITGIVGLLPTGQAVRVATNALSGVSLFEDAWLAYPIIAAWGLAAYAILLWRLARREA